MTSIAAHNIENKEFYAKRFALWLAIASMMMMFAGFTSAYIVKKADSADWINFPLPNVFYISTLMIVMSSITLHIGIRFFKKQNLNGYRRFLGLTLILGILFIVFQIMGWVQLQHEGIVMNEVISGAFFYVISGTHALHVLGGVLILLISFIGISKKIIDPVYDATMQISPQRQFKVSLVATYWHFVDGLWIYLFFFLLYNHI
jgi:cytochrome c oxidase subunit III